MGKYFSAIPTTYYNNTLCVDIMRATQFSKSALNNIKLFYTFDVPEGIRPDTISSRYYNDPYYDWILYQSNQIVDPYYDWPLTDDTLEDLIVAKYGSIAQAIEKVLYYKVNWEGDTQAILPSTYNQFSDAVKQYWRPEAENISAYVRKELDWKVATNQTARLYLNSPSVFVQGDYIHQLNGSTVTASGEVCFVGPTYVLIQSIEGTFTANSTVSSPFTDVNTTVSSTATPYEVISYSIPLEEQVYWDKMTAYDYEQQLNHEKRKLTVIDKRYVGQVQRDFEDKIVNG